MAFTGNNIAPKGDMASRSLVARIEVARPNPENRPFRHADPVAWTLENRGAILQALYTILLANPQLRTGSRVEAKTRFKSWWSFVGAALEHASDALVDDQLPVAAEDQYAKKMDFAAMFASVEGEDEDGAEISQVLDVLATLWPGGEPFHASDVAKATNNPMAGEDAQAIVLRV